jgi:CheY-like chemotaxis protein
MNTMSTIKVLFFDDEDWYSKTLQRNLQDNFDNYSITRVSNIESFLQEITSDFVYDLFIMDIMIPIQLVEDDESIRKKFTNSQIKKMNNGFNVGEVLYEKIRDIKKYSTTPILFFSNKKSLSLSTNYTSVAFLKKPELAKNINEKILELLNA